MKNKKLIIGGSVIVFTLIFLKLFLKNSSSIKSQRIKIGDEGECPLNRIQDEERNKEYREKYDAFITQCRKNNPLAGFTFGGKKTINNLSCAESYDRYQNQPTAWIDLDCSEKEKKAYKDYMDRQIAEMVRKGYTGEFRPYLSPQSTIAIDKMNGKFDNNKNYNKSCGSEVCWVYVDNKWVRES